MEDIDPSQQKQQQQDEIEGDIKNELVGDVNNVVSDNDGDDSDCDDDDGDDDAHIIVKRTESYDVVTPAGVVHIAFDEDEIEDGINAEGGEGHKKRKIPSGEFPRKNKKGLSPTKNKKKDSAAFELGNGNKRESGKVSFEFQRDRVLVTSREEEDVEKPRNPSPSFSAKDFQGMCDMFGMDVDVQEGRGTGNFILERRRSHSCLEDNRKEMIKIVDDLAKNKKSSAAGHHKRKHHMKSKSSRRYEISDDDNVNENENDKQKSSGFWNTSCCIL